MEKKKLFTGILLFGSLWGFSEIVIGSLLRSMDLPAGAIMSGVFALGLMLLSRMLFKTRGMQLGMGLVAGLLRFFNPFGSCHICSAIAIMVEGLAFELIFYGISEKMEELSTPLLKSSIGVVTSYGIYVIGYVLTQILTPVFSSAGFHLENLLPFIPQILASGLLAAVIGGVTAPMVLLLKEFDVKKIENGLYYPVSLLIAALCWAIALV